VKRREFSAKVKLQAWERAGGLCEVVWCKGKLMPGKFAYDHVIPDWMGGEPELENCQVICQPCHKDKTNKDAASIAKSRRIIKRVAGIRKKRSMRQWRRFDRSIVKAPRER